MAQFTFAARPSPDALSYFRDKTVGQRFSFDWRDLWQEEHVTSFVVAKMASADLLADTHRAVLAAIEQGLTREQFILDLRPTLEKAGWWGRQAQTDPTTGEVRRVQLGSRRRLATIYDTNMRMAHAAGAWQRIEAAKTALPYLVYTAVLDERTRPRHAAWGGRGAVRIILPVDHPFWRTHYPPNGWRCRCTVMQMSAQMLAQRGWSVTSDEALTATEWTRTRPWLNRRTGQMMTVPADIDPGFAYNVGLTRRAGLTPPPTPQPARDLAVGERWPRALPPRPRARGLPRGVARRPELAGAEADTVFGAFSGALGVAEGQVFFDAAQIPLVISRALFEQRDGAGRVLAAKADKAGRAEWAEVLAATLADPAEIWVSAQRQQDGRIRLVRTYVAAWSIPGGERVWFSAAFTERDGWWTAVTAFPVGKRDQVEAQGRYVDKNLRVGTLIYRRGR